MITFRQEIKFIGSFIVSDDTGKLMQLIHALAILISMLIALLHIIGPLLIWLQDALAAYQVGSVILGIRISSLAWGLGLTQ